MYLDKRGANKEAVDIYGNTPLGVALKSKHHNYCIIMIQKESNVSKLVHPIEPERIEKMWRQQGDVDMEYSDEDKKAHRRIFDNQNKNSDDDEGSEECFTSDEDSDDKYEQNAFNTNTAFGQPVFGSKQAITAAPIEKKKEDPKSMFRIAINHG